MTDVVELTPDACTRLLAAEEVGRLAFAGDDGYPVVLPVNHRLDGALIVFRTAEGLKLESFRCDVSPSRSTGWILRCGPGGASSYAATRGR